MVKVSPLSDKLVDRFKEMFNEYYSELGCADDTAHLVEEYIVPDMLAGLLCVDLIEEDGVLCGFVIYQIDDIVNEWNLKEGWGDISEIYISPSRRRKGNGKFLLYSAEMKLKERGAKRTYCLPCEQAAQFFTACGYEDTGEYCEDLDCNIFQKNNLNNGCKNE